MYEQILFKAFQRREIDVRQQLKITVFVMFDGIIIIITYFLYNYSLLIRLGSYYIHGFFITGGWQIFSRSPDAGDQVSSRCSICLIIFICLCINSATLMIESRRMIYYYAKQNHYPSVTLITYLSSTTLHVIILPPILLQ